MIESFVLLILLGIGIGTIGTLIGAGGGFILVPVLILLYPDLDPEHITAISLAIVATNASVGTLAYIRDRRIDYKATLVFAIATIPGSIIGVMLTKVIPRGQFDLIFGIVLILLSSFLFFKGGKDKETPKHWDSKKLTHQKITDRHGKTYEYSYKMKLGFFIAILIGFFSPLLGIGGGVIHVPAMTEWLYFPVHVATATSQSILAIMAAVSVLVHYIQGSYDDPEIIRMIVALFIGIVPGALLGAKLSNKLKGTIIIKVLAVSLAVIGIRILFSVV